MIPRFKKLILSLSLLAFIFSSVLAPVTQAQSTWYDQDFREFYTKVYNPNISSPEEIFGERYTAAQVQWILYSMFSIVLNFFGQSKVFACIIQFATSGQIDDCRSNLNEIPSPAAINSSPSTMLAMFTDRPVSSAEYIKYVAGNMNLIPDAQAQGFGFSGLNPVLTVWRAMRDAAYLILVLIILVMAFMIMFRIKLSPQTVITVQSAIPRVVVALILITFSYAIAGFLIDLMYVVIALISLIIVSSGITTFNITDMFGALTHDRSILSLSFYYFLTFMMTTGYVIFSNIWTVIFLGPSGLIGIVLVILVGFYLIFATFRIWFMLIRAFVQVLLLTMIGPFYILMGTLSGGGVWSWIRAIAVNLAVFPVTGLLYFVAFFFLAAALPNTQIPFFQDVLTRLMPFDIMADVLGNDAWAPPLIWGIRDLDFVWLPVSVVVISMIPRANQFIQSLLSGKPFTYGTGVGEVFGPALAAGAWARGAVSSGARSAVGGAVGDTLGSAITRRLGTQQETTGGTARTRIPTPSRR